MEENGAFREGYDAYFAGADPEENPYHYGTTEQFWWDRGFAQAEADDTEPGKGRDG
jgi:hypothetical protein